MGREQAQSTADAPDCNKSFGLVGASMYVFRAWSLDHGARCPVFGAPCPTTYNLSPTTLFACAGGLAPIQSRFLIGSPNYALCRS